MSARVHCRLDTMVSLPSQGCLTQRPWSVADKREAYALSVMQYISVFTVRDYTRGCTGRQPVVPSWQRFPSENPAYVPQYAFSCLFTNLLL